MRTKTIEVYQYKELSEKAKEKARIWFLQGDDFQFEWDCMKEDTKTIGLDLQEWDYGRYAKGKFIDSAEETAHKIEKEHGEQCETYKTAKTYLASRDNVIEMAERDESGNFVDECEVDKNLDELDAEFLKDLLEDYRIMTDKQLEYCQSEEYIAEAMESNEYEFNVNGKRV